MNASSSVFDSALYHSLFSTPQMKAIWSDENLIQTWLKFEIAIAEVQSDLGIIPDAAVNSIKHICQLETIDWQRLALDTAKEGMAIKPLIDQLTEKGDDLVKAYLHWGCTTQDLLDTSLAMRLKETLMVVKSQMLLFCEILEKMCYAHKRSIMVARTNAMDALPTTFGLQLSGYLQEMTRHLIRLEALFPRATTGLFGGAVGNLSSLDNRGIVVREALFDKLQLTQPFGFRNASLDSIVEVVQFFALVHGSLGRIANDVETLGRASIAELREGEIGGASSTMPHKANPRAANMIQALSKMGWMYASNAPNLLDQQDVRSASMRMLNWTIVPESALTISAALDRATRMIEHLIVDTQKMRSNFKASNYFIMAEAVMMAVAEKHGRGFAYNVIKKAITNAHGGQSLMAVLKQDPSVNALLTDAEIDRACLPENYLGCNDALIDETISYYHQTKNKLSLVK